MRWCRSESSPVHLTRRRQLVKGLFDRVQLRVRAIGAARAIRVAGVTSPLVPIVLLLAVSATSVSQAQSFSNFLELRIYTTKPEARDRFLDFFEEHYLESQEVLGMRIWGQFRDLETPTHFVWLRGYRSMEERKEGLMAFYTSPMWQETGVEVGQMLAAQAVPALPGSRLPPPRGCRECNRQRYRHDAGVDRPDSGIFLSCLTVKTQVGHKRLHQSS